MDKDKAQLAQEPMPNRLERLLWEYIDLQAAHPEHKPSHKTWSYLKIYEPLPAQEPVAWAVVGDGKFGKYELGQVFVDYEATHTYWENRGYELVPVYTTPPQRTEERNFCPRCGKRRGGDVNYIHTCTPPQEKNIG